MADEPHTSGPSVEQDPPTHADPETREETIARVVDGVEAVGAERGGSADPSTRRGVNRTLIATLALAGVVGAAVGGAIGLLFTDGGGAAMVVYAGVGALVVAVFAAYVTLAREDGRIEREVERHTGHPPEAPGSPSDPSTDLTPR